MDRDVSSWVRAWACGVTMLCWWVVPPLLSQAQMSGAQEPTPHPGLEDLAGFLEEETVSIAIRHEQPISKAPAHVHVITDEDIRQSGAPDLPTVLRRIPGMEVIQVTGAEFNVSMRGNNQLLANKTLVLVDGRSIYIDAQGFMFWKGIPVTLPEIKRIEVLKGPASALYGFNAFDGVINIITKSPEDMQGTTIQMGGGEFGTLTTSAIQGGSVGNLGYRLSLGWDQAHQWDSRTNLAFRTYKFNLQTDYQLSGTSHIRASGGLVEMNRFDGPVLRFLRLDSDIRLPYVTVGYERQDLFLRAWWNQFEATSLITPHTGSGNIRPLLDPQTGPQLSFLGNTYNLIGQHRIELGDMSQLTYGMNYRLNTFSGNSVSRTTPEHRLGIYVQAEWTPHQLITVLVGTRLDLDSFIQPTVSPRGAFVFHPWSDHTVRIGVSVAHRPPTLFETFEDLRFVSPSTGGSLTFQGSNDLEPEKIVSYQLGYQGWYAKHRVRVRGDVFLNHITNLIELRPINPTLIHNANAQGTADIYGGEAGLEWLATRWLSTFANLSYQDITQSFGGTFRRAGPTFKVNSGLRGEWDFGLSGEVALHYVGKTSYPLSSFMSQFSTPSQTFDSRLGEYTLINLRTGYRFWNERAEVGLSVFNALTVRHKEHPLGETIGSRVMGWFTLAL